MTKLFFRAAKKSFRFLVDEFQCRVTSEASDAWGDELTYQNSTTAVNIRYEPREKYVFILLCRLVGGKVPEHPGVVHPDTDLNRYGLDDLLKLRAPALKILKKEFGVPFTERNLRTMVETYARGVRNYAADILHGDFSIFPELEKIVKRRAEEYRKKSKTQ